MLLTAARKLKKFGGGKSSTESPQGTKRKRAPSGDDTGNKTSNIGVTQPIIHKVGKERTN